MSENHEMLLMLSDMRALKAQRDALLSACKRLAEAFEGECNCEDAIEGRDTYIPAYTCECCEARAAIALCGLI